MSAAQPKVVFNCNVLLQAMLSARGPAWRCYQLLDASAITLYVSAHVLYELRQLPGRPQLRRFKSLTVECVEDFISQLLPKAVLVSQVPDLFTYPRDVDDAHYVSLAVSVGANYIVSRDRDLLVLMETSAPEGRDFRSRFPGLRIVDPVTFLSEVAQL